MRSPAFDANGNRILKITRREAGGADVADVETAERVIQVIYNLVLDIVCLVAL